jgi:arylsulfatase A-like enzyme
VLFTALAVGVLCGLAEVLWSYLLPCMTPTWRAVLPSTLLALCGFVTVAVVVDVALLLVGAAMLLCVALPVARWWARAGRSRTLRILLRVALVGGALSYLYAGWIGFYVLLPRDRHTLTYQLILFGGVAVVLGLVTGTCVLLEPGRKRRRVASVVVWGVCVTVLLLAVLSFFLAYRAGRPESPQITTASGGGRPHVLLVTLDTLRVDYLGCYGHPWIETPTCDELADHGTVFDMAIAQAPSTGPSHCSIMTSVYPFDHKAENGKPMKPGLVTLADVLRAHGYETVAFTSATTTRSINSGLQQGFERYVDSLVPWWELASRDELQNLILFHVLGIAQHSQIPGTIVTERALRWLTRRSNRPLFIWLHYFDPHSPYGAPTPYRDMYRGRITDARPMASERERYAEDITYADAQLGRFLEAFRAAGLYDDALVIVTSDHGEAFGEEHAGVVERAHGRYLYDTTQRVPLIIKPAGARQPSRRVSEQVELTDLAPTVLDVLGIPAPEAFRGKPLTELLAGQPFSYAGRDAHAFNTLDVVPDDATQHDAMFVQQLAIRSLHWKYIARPRIGAAELYNLRSDP